MAKAPAPKRILAEDFPEQSSWIGRLLEPINLYFEQVNSTLNKGLTLSDNLAATILTVTLDGTFPVRIAWPLAAKPISVIVGNAYRTDGTTFTLSSAVQVQWSFNQQRQLQIDAVVGITPTAARRYTVVLECKTG